MLSWQQIEKTGPLPSPWYKPPQLQAFKKQLMKFYKPISGIIWLL